MPRVKLNNYSVYVLFNSGGYPFWVGCTQNIQKRSGSWKSKLNQPIGAWILIGDRLSKSTAFELEALYIKVIGRKSDGGPLLNKAAFACYVPRTPEGVDKIRAGHLGIKLSEATRAKMSLTHKKIGKVLSPEHKSKLLQANLGRKFSAESRAKMSAARILYYQSKKEA